MTRQEPRFTPIQRWLAPRKRLWVLAALVGFMAVPAGILAWGIPTQRGIDARFDPVEVTVVSDPVFRGAAVADVTFVAPDGTAQRAETPVWNNPGVGDTLIRYWDTTHERLWFGTDGVTNPNIHVRDMTIIAVLLGVAVAVPVGAATGLAQDSARRAGERHERYKQEILDEIARVGARVGSPR